MIYNAALISTVEQSDPITHIYILYFILSHYGLSQVVEYSYLCYRVGPGCLSILCYVSAAAAAAAKSLQSCLTLCDPTDGSPPGSPVPGILQARTLEWVATSFSNA